MLLSTGSVLRVVVNSDPPLGTWNPLQQRLAARVEQACGGRSECGYPQVNTPRRTMETLSRHQVIVRPHLRVVPPLQALTPPAGVTVLVRGRLRGVVFLFLLRLKRRFHFPLSRRLALPSRSLSPSCTCGACSAERRLGDMASRVAIPKMLMFSLKTRLGLTPDFRGLHEATANTSLAFHAGEMPR